MKKIICEAIFSGWCDGGEKPGERKEVQQAINVIGNRFNAGSEGKITIETEIMKAVCVSEKIAFMDGLRIGIGLVSGRLFYDDLPEIEVQCM